MEKINFHEINFFKKAEMLFLAFAIFAIASTNIINSTVANQSTTVPIVYRAIIGIILIIICIVAIFKFMKYAIGGLLALIILLILLSTAYYFFKTGTFSIAHSLQFLSDAYNFFIGKSHAISTTVNSITNISKSNSIAVANNSTSWNTI